MAGARRYDELEVWQLANELKLGVYRLIQGGRVSQDIGFRDQLRNSARAAPRLIAEGFGRYRPGEFARYLRWANGEVHETSNTLRDGVDQGYFEDPQIAPLITLATRTTKGISSLIRYLEHTRQNREP